MKTAGFDSGKELSKGIYAIAGISKNAGKTSFLNFLANSQTGKRIGILTTGRDGELIDEIYGNPKPAVRLTPGTLYTAISQSFEQLGSAIRIVEKLPYSAATGPLWLLETLRDVETEITGPANALDQVKTAELMLAKGAEIVLIDGSLDRKSIALRPEIKGVFLVAGGSYGNLEKINSELTRLIHLSQISVFACKPFPETNQRISLYTEGNWQITDYQSMFGNEQEVSDLILAAHPEKIYLPGAVTDAVLHSIKPALKGVKSIIVRHPLHLHLSNANLDYLTKNHVLSCLQPFRILALALNSWSVTGNHLDSNNFRNHVRKNHPELTVIDIYEQ